MYPKELFTSNCGSKNILGRVLNVTPVLFLTLSFILNGCSMMKIPTYPKTSATSINNAKTKNGFCIAVRAISDKSDLERYFGTDISKIKILPLYVVAENNNPSASFVIWNNRISLKRKSTIDSVGQEQGLPSNAAVGNAAMFTATLLTVPSLISLPLAFAGAQMNSNQTVINHNLVSKSLFTHTVSPGNSVDGFVYFNLPEDETQQEDWSVFVEVTELGSDSNHKFELNLD